MGIDEAGRGPVLGPMVAAGVAMTQSCCERFKEMGLKDSKKLSPQKRKQMFDLIQDEALWVKAIVIWPSEIDVAVKTNGLNRLERDMFSEIINAYEGAGKIIVDSPQDPKVFTAMINEKLECERDLLCSFKADDLYPVVSAASVVAKLTRDSIIEELKVEYGDFGSGYPADPKTKDFLSKMKDAPFFVRRSWKTYSELNLL
jgi:ribonuclease HII